MSSLWRRMIIAGVALITMATGVLSNGWWRMSTAKMELWAVAQSVEIDVGLRSVSVCSSAVSGCLEMPLARVMRAQGRVYQTMGSATFYIGLAVICAIGIGVYLREFHGEARIAKWAGLASLGIVAMSVFTAFCFPGGLGDPTLGYSFYLTIAGAIGITVAGFQSASDDGTYVPVVPLDGEQIRQSPGAPLSGGHRVPVPDYNQVVRDAALGAVVPPKLARHRANIGGLSSVPIAAVDSSKTLIRFAADSLEIHKLGLSAQDARGVRTDIAWANIVRVVARQLPPDPPFLKTIFVDIVPADGRRPIRLLASTRANYEVLSGGQALGSRENFRKLVALIQRQAPASDSLIDAESRSFFAGNVPQPPAFSAAKAFADFDARYDNALVVG